MPAADDNAAKQAAPTPIWLLVNRDSGSFSEDAVERLRQTCRDGGAPIERFVDLHGDGLPDAKTLKDANIETLAVHGGDGTVNSVIAALDGWRGAVLVLPGGTMNLLAKRLHGDVESEEIANRYCRGAMARQRPVSIRCDAGVAFAGLLAGPGTSWASVREAMRRAEVSSVVEEAGEAIRRTAGDPRIRCIDPSFDPDRPYPLIEMTPGAFGIQLDGYDAEHPTDYARHGWALLRRAFREGPHERLGLTGRVTIAGEASAPIDILLDGEAAQLPSPATFEAGPAAVDLWVSENEG